MDISIIIPAYNEEKHLEHTLKSISRFFPQQYTHEIIVVDNHSTDNTPGIAKQFNTTVLEQQGGTIGALRNSGFAQASGNIIIFLDADVSLTRQWMDNFPNTYNTLLKEPLLVTGSTYGISENASWIESSWFAPLITKPLGHINSGHLIVTRELFNKINGFDETLATGEDYDFSMRAKAVGARIQDNQILFVRHAGYPSTIKGFFLREAWHGMGDFQSFQNFISSYVAILALVQVFLTLSLLVNVFITHNYTVAGYSLLAIFVICLSLALYKFRNAPPKILLIDIFLYYLYFIARAYSLIRVLVSSTGFKRKRH